jgi:hypothetical protein
MLYRARKTQQEAALPRYVLGVESLKPTFSGRYARKAIMLFRYATTTYAAQIVMLAKLTYMFDRQDWKQAIDNNRHVPVPTELQVIGTSELFGRSAARAQEPAPAIAAPVLKAQPVASEPAPLPRSYQVSLDDLLGDQAEDEVDVDDLLSDDF